MPSADDEFDGYIKLGDKRVHVSDAETVGTEIRSRLQPGENLEKLLRQLAVLCCSEGFWDASRTYLFRLLSVASASSTEAAECILDLGRAREGTGDYIGALADYEQSDALEEKIDDTWYFLRNNRGFCLNRLGRHEEAESFCRRAIEINEKRFNAFKNLGLAFEGQGQYAKAAAHLLRAAYMFPPDLRSLSHLADLLAAHREEVIREIPDIEKHIRKAIELRQLLLQ